jgi:hypothetical protein
LAVETRVSTIKLITVAKASASLSITCTHYGDTNTTGTNKTMSPLKTGYRVTAPRWQNKLNGDPFHSLKFTITNTDEAIGFEPLAAVMAYHPVHID